MSTNKDEIKKRIEATTVIKEDSNLPKRKQKAVLHRFNANLDQDKGKMPKTPQSSPTAEKSEPKAKERRKSQ